MQGKLIALAMAAHPDDIEFMMAGASTVQVGTANLADPTAMERIVNEMDEWCDKNNVKDINEIVGTLKD